VLCDTLIAGLSLLHDILCTVAGVNQTFVDGIGLLHMACLAQNFEAVQFLISMDANLNQRDSQGLFLLYLSPARIYSRFNCQHCVVTQISNF
jgi:ankyrin repeat protein